MKLRVSHLSRYEYPQAVSFSPHALYLRPRETPTLRVHGFKFNVSPNAKLTETLDPYDNHLTWAHFWDHASALSIRTEFEIENLETNPFDFVLRGDAASFPFKYEAFERFALEIYLSPPSQEAAIAIQRWTQENFPLRPKETLSFLTELTSAIFQSLHFRPRYDLSVQSTETTILKEGGTARDLAIALVEIARSFGIAARFVSGYLYSESFDTLRTPDAMHSWAEFYIPGAGWKGVDPSHRMFCTDRYIPVAHGPMAGCVSPIQGSYYSEIHVPSELTAQVLVEKLA